MFWTKVGPPKRKWIFQTSIFRCKFVSFRYVFGFGTALCDQLQLSLDWSSEKNRVFILFLSQDPPRFLLFIFFTSTSFGQKPTTNNPSRQKHLRKNASAMRWLRTDGKMRGLLGKKGGDSGRWSLEGSWQLPGIDKKKIKVNWHNPLRFTVNVIVLLEKARHVTALLHIFEKSVALMEK